MTNEEGAAAVARDNVAEIQLICSVKHTDELTLPTLPPRSYLDRAQTR